MPRVDRKRQVQEADMPLAVKLAREEASETSFKRIKTSEEQAKASETVKIAIRLNQLSISERNTL